MRDASHASVLATRGVERGERDRGDHVLEERGDFWSADDARWDEQGRGEEQREGGVNLQSIIAYFWSDIGEERRRVDRESEGERECFRERDKNNVVIKRAIDTSCTYMCIDI